jgi:ATP-binding cassette, subfamily B, multidrug efflux pump
VKPILETAWPYLRRYRRGILIGVGALVVKDIAGAVQPLFIRQGIDSLTGGFALSAVFRFAAALVLLAAIKGLFQFWMRVVLIGISRDVEYDIRNDLFRKLASLSWDFYARLRTGDIMARATNDLNAVRMMLGPALMYWLETLLTFVLALSIMLAVDWPLTLLALTPAPLVTLVVLIFGRKIHSRFEKIQTLFSDISSRVQENLAGARVIRAYVQEEAELARFAALNQDFIGENLHMAKLSGLFMPLLQALIGITFLIVLWVGGLRLLSGHISLGSFVMFNTFMGMLVWPMIAFGWVVNLIQRGTASLKRIDAILREKPLIAGPPHPTPMPDHACDIEFRGVSMVWASQCALEDVSLTIAAGSTVAFVGRTGSGKSTLVHLIPRIFDPTSGVLLWGGIDVRDLSPDDLRRKIGFVPQETFLFSATLAENIAFGVDRASEEQVRRAAEMAGLAPDIDQFPDGYKTVIGERGITLSGGQKQRTAIARALLREPQVLILDDALSSVDTLTEERILHGIAEFTRERTTILISHRVSTVKHANCIYVLDDGRIREHGTHAQLLALGGYYAELDQKQQLEEELETI